MRNLTDNSDQSGLLNSSNIMASNTFCKYSWRKKSRPIKINSSWSILPSYWNSSESLSWLLFQQAPTLKYLMLLTLSENHLMFKKKNNRFLSNSQTQLHLHNQDSLNSRNSWLDLLVSRLFNTLIINSYNKRFSLWSMKSYKRVDHNPWPLKISLLLRTP